MHNDLAISPGGTKHLYHLLLLTQRGLCEGGCTFQLYPTHFLLFCRAPLTRQLRQEASSEVEGPRSKAPFEALDGDVCAYALPPQAH